MRKNLLTLFLCFFSGLILTAGVLSRFPDHSFVFDNANLLTSAEIVRLEKQLQFLKDSSRAEIIVLTVDSSMHEEIEKYAEQISKEWVNEHKLKPNNILFILDPTDRKFSIIGSQTLSESLDLALLKKIEEKYLLPQTRQKHYFEGINNSLEQIHLLFSGKIDESELNSDFQGSLFVFVTLLVFFFIIFFPVIQYKIVLQNHYSTRKPGFLTSLMLMNSFGAHRGGFDAFAKNQGIYESRKAALLRGGGGSVGVW